MLRISGPIFKTCPWWHSKTLDQTSFDSGCRSDGLENLEDFVNRVHRRAHRVCWSRGNGRGTHNVYLTVEEAAKTLGLTIRSEPRPEAGFCYRSDRCNLARVGIPSFSISEGLKFKGQPINSSLGWILRATRSWLRSLMNSE